MPEKELLVQEIKEILSRILETEPENIQPESRFVEDLGMDSMMALEIVASIEKRYKITIPEQDLPKFKTLKDILNLLDKYLNNTPSTNNNHQNP